MGNTGSHDPRHVRIWNNLSSLGSSASRIQMLETLLAGQEYIVAAKRAGIYSDLLQWIVAERRGTFFPWPDPLHQNSHQSPMLRITDMPPRNTSTSLATVPPPKRALDVLHESYRILGIDDSKPLTHEMLRSAYKRAGREAHPDKGGSPEQFDAVTRAYTYLQEVLNKLIPKSGKDERFTTVVNPENALKARGITVVPPAPAGTQQIEDAPPIALNPKKLDMAVFNKLFEENRLPDPDKDDGYGDWLQSQDTKTQSQTALRGKYNKDMFNKLFEEETRRHGATNESLTTYRPPSELVLAPQFGNELGGDRPQQYTKPPTASGIGYTDLKYAYSDGSTFSQEVANVSFDGRPKTLEDAKREYGSAPRPLTSEESAILSSIERAKEEAELARQRRAAARDVESEHAYERMQRRLLIK